MKIKIILINIVILSVILLGTDYATYRKFKHEYKKNNSEEFLAIYPPPRYSDFYKNDFVTRSEQGIKKVISSENPFYFFRENTDITTDKTPIVLFGCSFTYGSMLDYNQTIGAKLAKLSKRNVYNRGLEATGMQHMLYMLEQDDFYKTIPQEPEYVIYIYIPSHIQRLYLSVFSNVLDTNGLSLTYDIKGNNLQKHKYNIPDFLQRTFLVKSFFYDKGLKIKPEDKQTKYKNFALTNEILLKAKEVLNEHYPNIKFIILKYNIEGDQDTNFEMPFMWEVLEKEGFTIINSEDLIGRKYKLFSEDTVQDGYHPSEKAWDMLLPKLIEKLKL